MRNRESEAEELEKLKTKKGKIGTGCEDIREVADKSGLKIVCSCTLFVQLKLENVQSKRNICAVHF